MRKPEMKPFEANIATSIQKVAEAAIRFFNSHAWEAELRIQKMEEEAEPGRIYPPLDREAE